jgi:beta-lactamase regulating signal transducer with metallopeptidase domain
MFASSSSSPIVSIAWTLIHSIWQGAFIWLIYRLARMTIRNAAWRVHLGHAALMAFVLAQCVTFTYIMNAGTTTAAPIGSGVTLLQLAESEAKARKLPLPQLAPTERLGTWIAAHEGYLPWLVAAWGIGLTLQIAHTLSAYYLLQRHLNSCPEVKPDVRRKFSELATRIGLRQTVRFVVSELVFSPATARWLKPVVLVPAATMLQLAPLHLEALILHELAHIKRWDYATNILRTFVSALFFFHVLVRDICGRTADDAEAASDALASKIFGDDKTYAEALVELAELRRQWPMLLGANGGDLRRRILHMIRQRSLPGVDDRWRASLAGTLLSGFVGVILVANATAWATHSRDTMNRLTQKTYEEIVVEALSHNVASEAFLVPLERAISEVGTIPDTLSATTANELADALLAGVDPHVLYRRICAYPGRVDLRMIREEPFGPFGDAGQREDLITELAHRAQVETDPARSARLARAALVFASLQVPVDSGTSASNLLRNTQFIGLLRLSQEDYHLLELNAAVSYERTLRLGRIIASDRGSPKGANDAEVETFAAELAHMPAFQLTLCNKMSIRFQRRVLAVLQRDQARYPPGSLRYALEHAGRD